MNSTTADPKPLITAGMFLGIGMGGFVDGIVFHQILQTHNMLSARVSKSSIANIEINMFWDGLFHALTWMITAVGLWLLWRAVRQGGGRPSGWLLVGALLVGWGLFNLVEGVVDHHLLQLHHVVERLGVSVFDYGFLASGAIFVAGGVAIIRGVRRNERERRCHVPRQAMGA